MKEEFYIGQIFEGIYPPEAAIWCNQNNVYIDVIGEKRYEIKEIPAPSIDELKEQVRDVRDSYINDIEWRVSRYRDQHEISIETTDSEEEYMLILHYMQYLRDYPESSETWYEQNPLTYEEWKGEDNNANS